jgi:hypothetical protein
MIDSGLLTAAKIEAYSRHIDRTLLRENLKLTPAQRLEKFVSFSRFISELRRAGEKARRGPGAHKHQG